MTLKQYEDTLHAVFNCNCSLSALGRGVVAVIATVMYYSKRSSKCKISTNEIAARLNVSRRAVQYTMRELENKGIVIVTARDRTTNVYELNIKKKGQLDND